MAAAWGTLLLAGTTLAVPVITFLPHVTNVGKETEITFEGLTAPNPEPTDISFVEYGYPCKEYAETEDSEGDKDNSYVSVVQEVAPPFCFGCPPPAYKATFHFETPGEFKLCVKNTTTGFYNEIPNLKQKGHEIFMAMTVEPAEKEIYPVPTKIEVVSGALEVDGFITFKVHGVTKGSYIKFVTADESCDEADPAILPKLDQVKGFRLKKGKTFRNAFMEAGNYMVCFKQASAFEANAKFKPYPDVQIKIKPAGKKPKMGADGKCPPVPIAIHPHTATAMVPQPMSIKCATPGAKVLFLVNAKDCPPPEYFDPEYHPAYTGETVQQNKNITVLFRNVGTYIMCYKGVNSNTYELLSKNDPDMKVKVYPNATEPWTASQALPPKDLTLEEAEASNKIAFTARSQNDASEANAGERPPHEIGEDTEAKDAEPLDIGGVAQLIAQPASKAPPQSKESLAKEFEESETNDLMDEPSSNSVMSNQPAPAEHTRFASADDQ